MLPQFNRPTVHYTELRDVSQDDPHYDEWHTYLQGLPGWLAEGREGQFVLIKGTEVIGIYDSWDAAHEVFGQRFSIDGAMIQHIREREPLYRTRAV
jgi:hypothetical protein